MCGEELYAKHLSIPLLGTPPRVWGRERPFFWPKNPYRDTPTCVGKSFKELYTDINPKGHPHVCGEEIIVAVVVCAVLGTPPRVWGRAEWFSA